MEHKPQVDSENEIHWTVDRRVPVALIVTISLFFLGQTVTAVWWASGVNTRLEAVEHTQLLSAPQAERIIRLESKLDALSERMSEIKGIVSAPKENSRR